MEGSSSSCPKCSVCWAVLLPQEPACLDFVCTQNALVGMVCAEDVKLVMDSGVFFNHFATGAPGDSALEPCTSYPTIPSP